MRQIKKIKGSKIKSAKYTSGNLTIIKELIDEQDGYCAYTEKKFASVDARDIEHFNPKIKNTGRDGYSNWYAVFHLWNGKKSVKWDNFQPCLSPCSSKVNKFFKYDELTGFYLYNIRNTKVDNLAELVGLNAAGLPEERRLYIKRIKFLDGQFRSCGSTLQAYFINHPTDIHFRTAINTIFGFLP